MAHHIPGLKEVVQDLFKLTPLEQELINMNYKYDYNTLKPLNPYPPLDPRVYTYEVFMKKTGSARFNSYQLSATDHFSAAESARNIYGLRAGTRMFIIGDDGSGVRRAFEYVLEVPKPTPPEVRLVG